MAKVLLFRQTDKRKAKNLIFMHCFRLFKSKVDTLFNIYSYICRRMKSKGLFLCLLSGVLGLIGCAPKKMPEGDLIRVEYTRSGTMAGYEFEGRVEQDSAGSFVIRAMKESYGALYEKKVSPEVLQHFRQIIEEEKMYKYKESYRPKLEVLDGWGWSFSAKFSDGSSIYSHGSNASPSGNGLGKIWGYMESLIEEGGVKIKDAPFEQDETDLNESDN